MFLAVGQFTWQGAPHQDDVVARKRLSFPANQRAQGGEASWVLPAFDDEARQLTGSHHG